MPTISEIRTALKTALATVDGLNAYDVLPPTPRVPAAAPELSGWEEGQDFDGDTTYRFTVYVFVGAQDIYAGQAAMDAYLSKEGASSLKAALEADPTLGGVVQSLSVTGGNQYDLDAVGATQPLVGGIDVEIYS